MEKSKHNNTKWGLIGFIIVSTVLLYSVINRVQHQAEHATQARENQSSDDAQRRVVNWLPDGSLCLYVTTEEAGTQTIYYHIDSLNRLVPGKK